MTPYVVLFELLELVQLTAPVSACIQLYLHAPWDGGSQAGQAWLRPWQWFRVCPADSGSDQGP
jgi:hypothetical protein